MAFVLEVDRMVKVIELSKEEKNAAREWRRKKCGVDSFEVLFQAFHTYTKKKEEERTNGK